MKLGVPKPTDIIILRLDSLCRDCGFESHATGCDPGLAQRTERHGGQSFEELRKLGMLEFFNLPMSAIFELLKRRKEVSDEGTPS